MTNSLKTLVIGTALTSQCIHGGLIRRSRRLSTKHCGADAFSAYFSCSSTTLCVTSDDCNDGESCFEISCPIVVEAQDIATEDEETDIVSSDNVDDSNTDCGGHTASSCDECPMGNGEVWCNGDCRWDNITDSCVDALLDPTVSPTRLNTASPSSSPITSQPISQAPSAYPSRSPTGTPSDSPSGASSSAPSESPSISPSIIEIATSLPTTSKPTAAPTTSPSNPLNIITNSTPPTTSPITSSSPTWSPTITPTQFTTESPTTSPTLTYQNWTNFDYNHNKFCGPKIVGGYDIAVSACGPLTICGLSQTTSAYGTSGNDCPKNFMCYSDITCGNGPGIIGETDNVSAATNTTEVVLTSNSAVEDVEEEDTTTTVSTMIVEESTTVPEVNVTLSSESTTANSETAINTTMESATATTTTTTTTTEIITTTQSPNPIYLTTRAAFCGSFYAEAVHNCGKLTMCSSSKDCPEDEECFENVSCTYDPNEVVDTDDTEEVKKDDGEDKIMETNKTATSLEEEDRLQFGQNWETLPEDSNSVVSGKKVETFLVLVVVACGILLT